MKNNSRINKFSIIILFLFLVSCNNQNQATSLKVKNENQSKLDFENGFYCGFLDSKGILWFGSNGNGLYRYDGKKFKHFTKKDGLCDNQIATIIEDKEGTLWLGTGNGLCKFDRKTFTHIPIPWSDTSSIWLDKVYPIINPNQVLSILQDKKGVFWIGTNGAGAYSYDGKVFKQYLKNIGSQNDGKQYNIVESIVQDKENNIWFTSVSHGGVSKFDGETFTHYMPKEGLSFDQVRKSLVDNEGNIWFASYKNKEYSLDRFNGNHFKNFNKPKGLYSNIVLDIYQDKKANIWIAQGLEGLCVFDGKTFNEVTTNKGDRFKNVLFVIEDAQDNFVFGGSEGLWKYDGVIITNIFHANKKHKKCTKY